MILLILNLVYLLVDVSLNLDCVESLSTLSSTVFWHLLIVSPLPTLHLVCLLQTLLVNPPSSILTINLCHLNCPRSMVVSVGVICIFLQEFGLLLYIFEYCPIFLKKRISILTLFCLCVTVQDSHAFVSIGSAIFLAMSAITSFGISGLLKKLNNFSVAVIFSFTSFSVVSSLFIIDIWISLFVQVFLHLLFYSGLFPICRS